MVTKEQAIAGGEFHANGCSREIGPREGVKETVYVWRASGQCKTWKTRPDEFSLPITYGLYTHRYLTRDNAQYLHAAADCPLGS